MSDMQTLPIDNLPKERRKSDFSQSDTDSQQIIISIPSEDSNPQLMFDDPLNFPFTNITVNFPIEKNDTFINYMTYKIDFNWKNEPKTVYRRYSNLAHIRAHIRNQIPFSLVFPVHYKEFGLNKNSLLLTDRTEEINFFFRYITNNPQKFFACAKPLSIFFDSNLDENKVKISLNQLPALKYAEILHVYRAITKNYEFKGSRTEKRDLLETFNFNLNKNIYFFTVK